MNILKSIAIEVTTFCNLNCTMCFKKGLKHLEKRHLKFEDFKKFLDEAKPTEGVCFISLGEPLLNPDFDKILEETAKRGLSANLVTNATLLTEEWCKKLMSYKGNIKISISIDGATKETYESIRKNANFETVINNIRMLKRIRDETQNDYGKQVIRLDMVITKQNIKEIPALIALSKDIGINSIMLLHPQCLTKKQEKQHTCNMSADEIIPIMINVVIEASKSNTSVTLRKFSPLHNFCTSPWVTAFINTNGDVYPCCAIGCIKDKATEYFKNSPIEVDAKSMIMGNLHEQSFSDIWNGDKYNKFREECKEIFDEDNKKIWSMKSYIKLRKDNLKPKNYCKTCPIRFSMAC